MAARVPSAFYFFLHVPVTSVVLWAFIVFTTPVVTVVLVQFIAANIAFCHRTRIPLGVNKELMGSFIQK